MTDAGDAVGRFLSNSSKAKTTDVLSEFERWHALRLESSESDPEDGFIEEIDHFLERLGWATPPKRVSVEIIDHDFIRQRFQEAKTKDVAYLLQDRKLRKALRVERELVALCRTLSIVVDVAIGAIDDGDEMVINALTGLGISAKTVTDRVVEYLKDRQAKGQALVGRPSATSGDEPAVSMMTAIAADKTVYREKIVFRVASEQLARRRRMAERDIARLLDKNSESTMKDLFGKVWDAMPRLKGW